MVKNIVIICLYLSITHTTAFAQLPNTDSTTMYYLQLKPFDQDKKIKHEFVFVRGPWRTPVLTPIVEDSLGVFVKFYIPDSVYQPEMFLTCKAMVKDAATDTAQIARTELIDLNTVQLSLTSNPRKVAIYMIPTRIWLNELKKANWKKDPSLLSKYLLTDDYTTRNLVVAIDNTLYTLMYQLGDKYIITPHKLQPGHERFQQERADFVKKLFSD